MSAVLETIGDFPVPNDLAGADQWVVWRYEMRDGKQTKVPYSIQGTPASSTDFGTWASYRQAVATWRANTTRYAGIGFVFSEGDPYAGIDLDDCRNPETGAIAEWASTIIAELDSYTEVSPSGTGVKVFVQGQLPAGSRNRGTLGTGQIEMYSRRRYFTVTSRHLEGTPTTVEDRQAELMALHLRVFGPGNGKPNAVCASRPLATMSLGDSDLLERARGARNGAKFQSLWDGHWKGDYVSQSEADMALCSKLAFWTGCDPVRIDALFRQSGLRREKWEREDYRVRTIQAAIEYTNTTYGAGPDRAPARVQAPPVSAPATPSSHDQEPGSISLLIDSDERREGPTPDYRRASGVDRESQATKLIKLVDDHEYFHSPEGRPYTTFSFDGHLETHPVRSKAFRTYLQRRYYADKGQALGGKALQDALGVLEAKAMYDGTQHNVHCRVGESDNNIYIDLGSSQWDAIEVTREGWGITPRPPVKFRRTRGMLPIPYPTRVRGAQENFRALLNVKADRGDLILVTAWELAAMRSKGPFPVLVLNSEQGSGKTTVSKLLRILLDPNEAPMRAQPKEERDLMIAASNSWIIGLDNLPHIPDWLSDAICRLSTGGGFATRELFTDEDEILFNVQRPVILNGIEEIATRGDLMDRAIIVELPRIPEDKRVTEKEFWARFEQCRPGILGYFLDGVCAALANLGTVTLTSLPRMADFAEWATAAEPSMGWEDGHFLGVYERNRQDANDVTIDASPIARQLRSIGAWSGTATALLSLLESRTPEQERKLSSWPKSPRGLSNALRRLAPSLRLAGLDVSFERDESRRRERLVIVREVDRG